VRINYVDIFLILLLSDGEIIGSDTLVVCNYDHVENCVYLLEYESFDVEIGR